MLKKLLLALVRPIRLLAIKWSISDLEARIKEQDEAVKLWEPVSRPSLLKEIAIEKAKRDRINGRAGRVSYLYMKGDART